MRRSSIAIIALLALCLPLTVSAQVSVSIAATPATAEVSKPITVTHSIAPASFSYADQIHLYDKTTNQLKDLQAVFGPATTNYFTIITPGSYEFRYYSGASNTIVGTSNTVTVALPVIDTSTMTFSATPATVGQNAVVSVTHTMPANAFSYSDQVQLFNTATNQMADVQVSYGANGTNNFIMRTPGTYEFRYYSAIKNTIVRTSNQVTVTAPVIDLTSVTLSATPATAITNSQIAVAHTIPAASFSYSDQVHLFDKTTNQLKDLQAVFGPATTNYFMISAPGTYEFRYYSAIKNAVVRTSNTVTVTAPSSSAPVTVPVTPPVTPPPPAPTPAPTPTPTPTPPPAPTTPPVTSGKIPSWMIWGAYVGWQSNAMANFEALVGKSPSAEMVFAHWGNDPGFPSGYSARIRDKGRTMVLFWEALDYDRDYFDQPEYSFDSILAGDHDEYLSDFAEGARVYGGQVILIPFSEFNGNWYPWGVSIPGNTPAKYIAAFRYVESFFDNAPNVRFAWVPHSDPVPDTPINAIEQYYPGSAYVDYVGVDGFNFGGSQQQTFDQVFRLMLTRLKQYNKPIWIFSMASAAYPGKAALITDALTVQLNKYPEVKGWMWFNENKEHDWRVNSDPASLAAFKAALP